MGDNYVTDDMTIVTSAPQRKLYHVRLSWQTRYDYAIEDLLVYATTESEAKAIGFEHTQLDKELHLNILAWEMDLIGVGVYRMDYTEGSK